MRNAICSQQALRSVLVLHMPSGAVAQAKGILLKMKESGTADLVRQIIPET